MGDTTTPADEELVRDLEHELHLHGPLAGICGKCGEGWPCPPIIAVAIALDVAAPSSAPAVDIMPGKPGYWEAANDPNRTAESHAEARERYARGRGSRHET